MAYDEDLAQRVREQLTAEPKPSRSVSRAARSVGARAARHGCS